MSPLACFLVLPLLAQVQSGPLPAFDEYEFRWTVAKSADVTLSIVKSPDVTNVVIRKDTDGLYLTPAAAEQIAAVLKNVDREYAAMRGSQQEVNSTHKAGQYTVTFHHNPQYGFLVGISSERLFLSNLTMTRGEVKAIMPELSRSVALAKHVDTLLDKALDAEALR